MTAGLWQTINGLRGPDPTQNRRRGFRPTILLDSLSLPPTSRPLFGPVVQCSFIRSILRNPVLEGFLRWSRRPEAPAESSLFFAVLLVASLPLSPFLLSISMWGLVFSAFAEQFRLLPASVPEGALPRLWRVLVRSFGNLFRQRSLAIFLLLLAVPAVSGLWSEDHSYWLERTRVRLPFLVLPWAFANLPPLSARQSRLVLYGLVWTMAVLCLGVGIRVLADYDAILQALQKGQAIPVPRNHIRFSLLLATSIVTGGYLWREGFVWRFAWERRLLAASIIFQFLFIHFLSVRSGLAALYSALLFSLGYFIWHTRRWGLGLALLAGLTLLPWLAVKTMPSLSQKVAYTVYDWQQYIQDKGQNYSDAERWVSIQTGWLIWKQHPLLGAGAGDLPRETADQVREHFPKYALTPKLPHNQFLYILAGTGLLGLAFSLLAFLYPVVSQLNQRHYLFMVFQIMVFLSFLVEYTIETAMGVAWYLFFTLWFQRLR